MTTRYDGMNGGLRRAHRVIDASGCALDALGCAADAPGGAADAPGWVVDAPGCVADAPGCAADARRSESRLANPSRSQSGSFPYGVWQSGFEARLADPVQAFEDGQDSRGPWEGRRNDHED